MGTLLNSLALESVWNVLPVLLHCSPSLSLYTACPAVVQVEDAVYTAWPAETPGDVMIQKVNMKWELVWIFFLASLESIIL